MNSGCDGAVFIKGRLLSLNNHDNKTKRAPRRRTRPRARPGSSRPSTDRRYALARTRQPCERTIEYDSRGSRSPLPSPLLSSFCCLIAPPLISPAVLVSSPLSFLLDLRGSIPDRFWPSHDRERRGETAPRRPRSRLRGHVPPGRQSTSGTTRAPRAPLPSLLSLLLSFCLLAPPLISPLFWFPLPSHFSSIYADHIRIASRGATTESAAAKPPLPLPRSCLRGHVPAARELAAEEAARRRLARRLRRRREAATRQVGARAALRAARREGERAARARGRARAARDGRRDLPPAPRQDVRRARARGQAHHGRGSSRCGNMRTLSRHI